MRDHCDQGASVAALDIVCADFCPRLGGIVEIAAQAFDAPIAVIAVMDATGEWPVWSLDGRHAFGPRDAAIAAAVIAEGAALAVPNALTDPRLGAVAAAQPEGPAVAYAGAPISMTTGAAFGVLYVADRQARAFTPDQLGVLDRLAELAGDTFRLRSEARARAQLATQAEEARALAEQKFRELRDAHALFDLASKLADLGWWRFDPATQSVSWSDGIRRIHRVSEDYAPTLEGALGFYDAADRPAIVEEISKCVEQGERFEFERPLRTADGRRRWVRSFGRMVDGILVGCLQDVTERHSSDEAIELLATRDPATGVQNRRALEAAYEKLRRRVDFERTPHRMLLIDLDNFKQVNEIDGFDVGDQMLMRCATLLRELVRSEDFVARIGADEFVVLQAEGERGSADLSIADRLIARLAAEPALVDRPQPVTASIGEVRLDDPQLRFSEALRRADMALAHARQGNARGRAALYTNGLGDASSKRSSVLKMADAALRDDRIVAFYQQKRSLSTGEICGFEALARLKHPSRGVLAPGQFLAAFDDMLTATRISEAVLTQAAADAARLRDLGLLHGRIAVNITERQLLDPTFCDRLDALVSAHDLRHDMFVLEMTENTLLSRSVETIQDRLTALSERGVVMSFDDFGTGWASLTHLRVFSIDQLKIDRSFVRPLLTDESCRAITQSMLQMATALGIETVAEGVEDAETAELLAAMGCDKVQGFYYAKPAPFEDAVAQLRAQQAHGVASVA